MLLLDEDSVEAEGMPADEKNRRAMCAGSLKLLCALQKASGAPEQERPRQRDYIVIQPVEANPFSIKCNLAWNVVESVARDFGIDPIEMTGKSRRKRLVHARSVVAMLLKQRGWSYPRIARAIGRGDHSTALYAVETFDIYAKHNVEVRESYHRHLGLMAVAA